MYPMLHFISLFLLINLLPSSESYKNDFNGTILDNLKDALQIARNYGSASSFIPTYQENHELAMERLLLAFFRKKADEARTCGQLIKSRGFDYEIFNVTTIDGYMLTGYHIINRKFSQNPKPRPFLLLPGGFGSCASFLVNQQGRSGSTAYYLAERGEDVYIINYRGSTYSRKHINLNPNFNLKFFDFTFEDIGTKDITATVESIKKATGYDKINVLAYSLASLEVLVQLSLDPSYSKNYQLLFLAGPMGYWGHIKGLYGTFPHDPLTIELLSSISGPFPPFLPFIDAGVVSFLCTYTAMEPLCLEIYNYISGPDTYETDITRLAVYYSVADTVSFKLFAHTLQAMRDDHPRRINLGRQKNLEKYGSAIPPIYYYEKVPTNNIVLLSGLGDYIATPENVQKLRNSFSERPLVDHIITYPTWNHMDFLSAKEADPYYNDVLYNITKRYENDPTGSSIQLYNNVDSFASSQN